MEIVKLGLPESLDEIQWVWVESYLRHEVVRLKRWSLPEMKKLQDKDSSQELET